MPTKAKSRKPPVSQRGWHHCRGADVLHYLLDGAALCKKNVAPEREFFLPQGNKPKSQAKPRNCPQCQSKHYDLWCSNQIPLSED